MKRFKNYLSREIEIEYKSCLYFFAMLFFYCVYCVAEGSFSADILILAELIAVNYLMCYVQVYLLGNFDTGESMNKFTCWSVVLCSMAYAGISYLFRWFDRKPWATFWYFLYVIFLYVCMFLVNRVKREIDTKRLNEELELFKQGKPEDKNTVTEK